MDTELIALCAMNKIFGFAPKIGRVLLDFFGSATRVFSSSEDELREALGPSSKYRPLISSQTLDESEEELEKIHDVGGQFIGLNQTAYPVMLRDCDDSPLGLYYRGIDSPEKVLSYSLSTAVVGTRNMSSYGKASCESIVKALSMGANKPVIISGLALGIDGVAHCSALENGLPTIAVLPTGIDTVYPARHYDLAERIVRTSGCALVSDFPLGTAPLAICFLRRNRIIAGLAQSTILVESKVKGGGMVTARLAASYGRDVYAVPGRMEDLKSGGCNALIAEKIAEPLCDLNSLSQLTGSNVKPLGKKRSIEDLVKAHFASVRSEEDLALIVKLLKIIQKNRDISIEELCRLTTLGYSRASGLILDLQTEGLIDLDLLHRCSLKGGI